MTVLSLDLPAMYGDHHVVEVRRILLDIPGVEEVYASSSFRVAEIAFDAQEVDEETIKSKLDEAGYMGDFSMPEETDLPANESRGQDVFFRHTAAYQQTKRTISFEQNTPYTGRPLWPCPGMKPIIRKMKD